MKIVLASSNEHKVQEIQKVLEQYGIELSCLKDFDAIEAPEETGKTFMENAELKARYYSNKLKMPVLADDSGLCVPSLNGEPGVYSARYAGENASDKNNNQKLLENLKDHSDRGAYFKCEMCLFDPEKEKIVFFVGICKGSLIKEERGEEGFGYDPLFVPNEFSKTFAEMTMQEKNKISHRSVALQGLVKYFNNDF